MSRESTTPSPHLQARLAAALRDEAGAARHDRLLILGAAAVLGALVLFGWATQDTTQASVSAAAGGAAQTPNRTVSSGVTLAPEPPPPSGADAVRTYVSSDHPSMMLAPPDNEDQLLEALTDSARAIDAAAFSAGAFGDAPSTGATAAEAPVSGGGDDAETVADGT